LAEELGAYCFNPFILVPTGRGKEIADQILDSGAYERLLHVLGELKMRSGIEVRVTCGPQFARVYDQIASTKQLLRTITDKSIKRTAEESSKGDLPAGCMGGRGFGFISYHGDVQTCGFLDVSAGNLIENGYDFAKIWLGSRFLNEIRDCSAYKGACGACGYVMYCGGCRARAYTMTGDYMESDPICRLVMRSA
jgi:radical SAM protein with 4Fe4S-binding SPASM domain